MLLRPWLTRASPRRSPSSAAAPQQAEDHFASFFRAAVSQQAEPTRHCPRHELARGPSLPAPWTSTRPRDEGWSNFREGLAGVRRTVPPPDPASSCIPTKHTWVLHTSPNLLRPSRGAAPTMRSRSFAAGESACWKSCADYRDHVKFSSPAGMSLHKTNALPRRVGRLPEREY